ncbi:uncharacterized protein [Cicer arietinum]|uniref:DNA-directed RNA polymerase III subunit RPC4-like n=1 Tax=Cicer arietinum TaxID=3827 RepID=A0A1S2XYB1_CICAR|nr:DNA-directed RNA polymerase III subunit RPC4-like [Cicer arietinum]
MDPNFDSKPPAPRKVKFAPKALPRKVPKIEVKSEVAEEDNATAAADAKELLRRFNENAMKARMKVEKKVSASQIAFGFGGESVSRKSYNIPKSESKTSFGENLAFNGVKEKEYQEPWDMNSNYPIALPLRKPYSGDPEYLNEEEFGEAAITRTYDESKSNSAMELGLLEENPEASAFFIKLPPVVPMIKNPAKAGSQDVKENSKRPRVSKGVGKLYKLNELPPGLMGKMLVYKSGAVKLKLGNTLYDVSSGMDCSFAQDYAAMNTAEKHCSIIGEITKHATITPDVDAALDCLKDLDL